MGTTTNDNAAAGIVGQSISSTVLSASGVSMSTGTPVNCTSISLTAGDWDVYGNASFLTTTATQVSCWASLTSATLPDLSLYVQLSTATALASPGLSIPYLRVSIAGTTTVYLSGSATFASSTCTISGSIFARRIR